MFICKVQGRLIATIKNRDLEGLSFVVLQKLGKSNNSVGHPFVAVDNIGCGEGDVVLVTTGAGARFAVGKQGMPIDTAVIGLVDSYNIK